VKKKLGKKALTAGIISIVALSATGIAGASGYFGDVSPTSTYAAAINWAKDQGIMIGTSSTTFDPNSTVTRAQLAQVLYNMSKQGITNAPSTTPAPQPTPSSTGVSTVNGFQASLFAQGISTHTNPDDVAYLNTHMYVAYQNGVGSKGEPSSSGNTQSTIVEYDNSGNVIGSWDVTGKVDGMAADPNNNRVLATVNEDANSSLYSVTPDAAHDQQLQHFTYSASTLTHGGGTDSIAVQNGNIYITASAPAADANGNYSKPALYQATIQGTTATLQSVLADNATATDAVSGKEVNLNLSDPDSSTVVPSSSPKFANDILLDSQGDSQLIFIQNPGSSNQTQTSLSLGTQVDDVTFATSSKGTLYVTDAGDNKVYAITGNFTPNTVFVACPSDSGVGGFVGTLDLSTGKIQPFTLGIKSPKGLHFVPQN
jgi:hypothetical protein